ncbi:hypothetical protein PsorP6_008443 [Peronosclerospora sorghi]|uniref:Uncharacterized protein n=1 Tax=Peronosclerospora sorghi TaxID=230839 RepID=A0ACC0W856_9STRA|nr:hypothetical protein PsorP6_008443 [Peronosclerospora sorghi]
MWYVYWLLTQLSFSPINASIFAVLTTCSSNVTLPSMVRRLLETFEEQGHFCLVLELLVTPVLNVERWGPWRRAPGSTRALHQSQPFLKQKTTDIGVWSSKEQG